MPTTQTDRLAGLVGDFGIKTPVRVATTAAITLSGEQTIDGVAVSANSGSTPPDRVLVKNQSDTTTNGIYDVSTGAWLRSKDFDGARDAKKGTLVYVTSGSTNGDSLFKCTSAEPILIDGASPSNLTFVALSTGTDGALGWFNVKDTAYGAIGDGTTDDTAAINLAIAALNTATRGVLYFPAGTYKCTSALTTVTATGRIVGDGMSGVDTTANGATVITCTSATASLFTIGSKALAFDSLTLRNTSGTTPSAGAGIAVTSSNGDMKIDYDSVAVAGFYIDIDVRVGHLWTMRNCYLSAPILYALKIRNTVNPDIGDWSITESGFYAETQNATSAIRIESSGGGKIANIKVNERGGSKFANGIDLAGAGNTVILQVTNSSFENYSGTAILASGTWPGIVITGCQFGQYGNGTGHAISISSNTDVVIDDISLTADTGTPTAIVISSVTRCSIGQIVNNGFSTLISGAVDQDATGSIAGGVRVTGTPTSGQVPTATSGTAATWQTPSGGGGGAGALVFLESHTASSSATLDFTTFISSTYDDYLFEFVGLQPASDAVNLDCQFGTGGGPTYQASNYRWAQYVVTDSGLSGIANSASDGAIHIFNGAGNTSTKSISGSLRLYAPQSASLHKLGVMDCIAIATDASMQRMEGGCAWADTTALTAVRFLFGSGNIASGVIRCYGVTKS